MTRDAVAAAQAVRNGEVTAERLVRDSLDRIGAAEAQVNAFTVVLPDSALARAREVDAQRATDPGSLPPLAGVPVSVKDHIWLAGQPATNGSRALRDFMPDVDAVPVARLKAAGAIVVGKTNNPEFCYRGFTDNDVWGLTRNPWALDRTPGGSSGGAGASVAYGATPIALGTDGGGSIRIPSAFCGLVGHKPTFGRIPKMPGFRGWPTLSVDGPLTRTVRDAALALAVLSGAAAADDQSWPAPPGADRFGDPVDWSTLRVAVSEDLGWAPVEPVVRAAFRRAVGALVADGAKVADAAPDAAYPTPLWNDVALPEGFASEGPLLARWGDALSRGTREIVESGRAVSAAAYLDALERRRAYAESWAGFFTEYDVLLTPSMPLPAFGTDVAGPASIDGVPVDPFFDDWCALALPANLTGQPACAVPTGFDDDGLPLGMQIMGPRWSDATVLSVAAAHERVSPWADRWPDLGDL